MISVPSTRPPSRRNRILIQHKGRYRILYDLNYCRGLPDSSKTKTWQTLEGRHISAEI